MAFGLKRAIDQGLVPGPQIYPSGPFISLTAGHGDFRSMNDPNPSLIGHRTPSNFILLGLGVVADGRAAILAATRQNLMYGASQIKIMGGGGGSSRFDPIDVTQRQLIAPAQENLGAWLMRNDAKVVFASDLVGEIEEGMRWRRYELY